MSAGEWGVSARRCLPEVGLSGRHPPVNRMTDACETLPCRNYVADGKNENKNHHLLF